METLIGFMDIVSHNRDTREDYVHVSLLELERLLDLQKDGYNNLVLRNDDGVNIDFQVDRPVPGDSSKDILIFRALSSSRISVFLSDTPGSFHPSTGLNFQGFLLDEQCGDKLEPAQYSKLRGIELENENINLWFSLLNRNGLVGCATSFRLNSKPSSCKEMLDYWQIDCQRHNQNKQFMKINKLIVPSAPWSLTEIDTRTVEFQVIYHSIGPIRGVVTLRSAPIFIPIEVKPAFQRQYPSYLYRVISIYPHQNWVSEELFLVVDYIEESFSTFFIPYYYMWCDFGTETYLYRYDGITGWFALGNRFEPFPSYGFATHSHSDRPAILDFNDLKAHREYEWKLGLGQQFRSLHAFNVCTVCDNFIGRLWYTQLLDKLTAKIIKDE
ncbi:MAG: hypothetical protein WAW37_03205 [Syntrophobacteraceae bacterium]